MSVRGGIFDTVEKISTCLRSHLRNHGDPDLSYFISETLTQQLNITMNALFAFSNEHLERAFKGDQFNELRSSGCF